MPTTTTRALLARVVDFRESDRICDLLCETEGRIPVIARGARRSRKRFGGALSLFVLGEATIRTPNRSGAGAMASLERFDCIEDMAPGLTRDLVSVAHGSYILELARELWPEAQPDPACFALVHEALRVLAAGDPSPALLRCYELRLLEAMGLAPSVTRCVGCGAIPGPEDRVTFNVARGGITCGSCRGQGTSLDPAVRRRIMALASSPLDLARSLESEKGEASVVRNATVALVRHHLGKPLKSLQFILELRQGQ